MAVSIIETNHEPFAEVEVDPISLDIIENALRNARFEMDAVLFRTAMSPGIREQHDEFPLIANRDGKMVVGQFGSFIHGFSAGHSMPSRVHDVSPMIRTRFPYASVMNAPIEPGVWPGIGTKTTLPSPKKSRLDSNGP